MNTSISFLPDIVIRAKRKALFNVLGGRSAAPACMKRRTNALISSLSWFDMSRTSNVVFWKKRYGILYFSREARASA